MRIVLFLLGGAALLGLALWVFMRSSPVELARRLRLAGGLALIALGGGLLYARQFALAVPLGVAGFMIMRREAGVRRTRSTGRKSAVSSQGLNMSLDHETGELDGEVLTGEHAGRRLSSLSPAELLRLVESFRGDAESLRLLESYLDRANPGWRDDLQGDSGERQDTPTGAGGMGLDEAYKILGLEQGAGKAEIREAHRRLMKSVHPDRGGSAALAAQINQAKDRILGQHR